MEMKIADIFRIILCTGASNIEYKTKSESDRILSYLIWLNLIKSEVIWIDLLQLVLGANVTDDSHRIYNSVELLIYSVLLLSLR